MKPYYQQDGITIYHADCLDILPTVAADVILTDPPYNSGLNYGAGTDDSRDDYWEWLGARIALSMVSAPIVLVKHSSLKIRDFQSRWPSRILVWSKPFSSGYPLNGIALHWEPIHWLTGKAMTWSKDVLEYTSGGSNKEHSTGHPAQMPETLASHLIVTFSAIGNVVCDPFCGSGTILVASKRLGRQAIGIETEERYCEIAATRLSQGVLSEMFV